MTSLRHSGPTPAALARASADPRLAAALAVKPRRAWRDDAACLGTGGEGFFGDGYRTTEVALARRICAACTVADHCLAQTLSLGDLDDDGIRAGTTPPERRAMRSAIRRGMVALPTSGAAA